MRHLLQQQKDQEVKTDIQTCKTWYAAILSWFLKYNIKLVSVHNENGPLNKIPI